MMSTLLQTAWKRMRANWQDPLIRKNVTFYMGGKLLGLSLVLVLMWTVLPSVVHAATGATIATPEINAVNTVWTLVAAFLVFCMQVGFVMLEAGFARSRESVNISWSKVLRIPVSAASCSGPGASPLCLSLALL